VVFWRWKKRPQERIKTFDSNNNLQQTKEVKWQRH
jgi:hypothetical protein